MIHSLDPLNFPLFGSRLIEASAGTGKTYTIAALYLRLVLQHGAEHGFQRPLMPPDILVVTFTRAATQELRDRIRARLVDAARAFREQAEPDDFLRRLRDDFPAERWSECAYWLDSAAQWMDEAAVLTIHSWCQQMLSEHAFASGSLFNQTLQQDDSELYLQVVKDYWRVYCYPLQGEAFTSIRELWGDPEQLWDKLAFIVRQTELPLPEQPRGDLSVCVLEQLDELEQQLAALKAPWLDWVDELQACIEEAARVKAFKGQHMNAPTRARWFESLREWAQTPTQTELVLNKGFERLTPEGLGDIWQHDTSPVPVPAHPALDAMVELPSALEALKHVVADRILWHAATWVRERFAQMKAQRAEIGFNDMLLHLDQALASAQGPALAAIIRQQFPVAMIDEFQDTDPTQYRIFDRIYQVAQNDPATGLFLIGDPKQAIYSFRGADIYTYLQAREATGGRHYSLDTNYRSTAAMVEAVNQLFVAAEQRSDNQGAFLFRQGQANPLPFVPVQASGRQEEWVVEGTPQPALTFWQLAADKPLSKGAYQQAMAQCCASEIVRLLNGVNTGYRRGEQLQRLAASDIAILVRDGYEAHAVRAALNERQVRSVYLSDRDSVFVTQEAFDLQLWLAACLQPEDERAVKAALASSTLGLTLLELEALQQDELLWEDTVLRFKEYQLRWQQQGVLPMVRQLLQDYRLPQRIVRQTNGERALTNLLHLAELLQQMARELDGQAALLQFLQHAYSDPRGEDEQVLRLESDAALVRVVTIHKSKGLEYPLVFLPFVTSYKPKQRNRSVVLHQQGQRTLHLRAEHEEVALQAEQERLAEDLRLLYVALTRARHACWLGMAELQTPLAGSALGYVLGAQAGTSELAAYLAPLVAQHTRVTPAPEPTEEPYQALAEHFEPQWREFTASKPLPWRILSYSALRTQGYSAAMSAPASSMEQVLEDDERVTVTDSRPLPVAQEDIHGFPRGANPGIFLHDLLEKTLFIEHQAPIDLDAQRQQLVEQLCEQRGYSEHTDSVLTWLTALMQFEFQLPEQQQFCLGRLTQWQAEMEFWFAAQQVSAEQLDQLVSGHILPGQARPELVPAQLNGMLKGFIDLVFEVDGRYFVADYKSNWLGENEQAYQRQAMDEAVLQHRYDMQYALYSLALHRLLKSRLADYDYDQHMGGVVYLFLRGMAGPEQGLHFVRPTRAFIEALDALFSGSKVQVA